MCGRFTLTSDIASIKKLIQEIKSNIAEFEPRYNIAPSQNVLAVLNYEIPELSITRWGLIPSWSKDPSIGSRMINARAETLNEKPSFKKPLKKRRCLIPADGFYEWQSVPGEKSKLPWYFRLKSRETFAFAGLWEEWLDNKTGQKVLSSTIITTTPNSIVEPVHNRMPVILQKRYYNCWLVPEERPPEDFNGMFIPYPSLEMEAYRVSKNVNYPSNDGGELIIPA